MLSMGLALNNVRTLKSNVQYARDAGAVLYLDARKATGSSRPTNSPLTSAWVDLANETTIFTPPWGEIRTLPNGVKDEVNLSTGVGTQRNSDTVAIGGTYNWGGTLDKGNGYYYATTGHSFSNLLNATANSAIVYNSDFTFSTIASGIASISGNAVQFIAPNTIAISIDKTKIDAQTGADVAAKIKAYFTANPITLTYQLLAPIYHSLGKNSAIPTNMAGTTASGVDTSDPLRLFWVLDGTDDFFSLVNTASVDITAAPLAIGCTFKLNATAGDGWIICKNLSAANDTQYGVFFNDTNDHIDVYINGVLVASTANDSITKGTWYNFYFTLIGENVATKINGITSGTGGTHAGAITTRANFRIGRRETTAGYFKGNLAAIEIYTGTKATESNILRAEKAISKAYIG